MPTDNYNKEIERIIQNNYDEEFGNLTKEQLATLIKYKEYYEAKKSNRGGLMKPASVWSAISSLRWLGIFLGQKSFEDATKQDLVDYFTIKLKGKSNATLSSWKVQVRSFYKWMHGMRKPHEFPEIVDDARLEPTRCNPRNISPSDLFNKDDLLQMLSVCNNSQDKAILSVWFEMGIRAKEYVAANVGSIEFCSGGCKFYVEESKTETGFIPLIQSAPYLQELLEHHPYKDNPKAPLFFGITRNKGNRLQPNAINQKLKRIAKKAGIKKRIFTHLGRNISITRLDGTLSVEDNARLHGITPYTLMNVYTKRSRKEAVQKYFDVYGKEKTDEEKLEEKEEKEKLLPKKCENCGEINSFERNYCKKCLRPIDIKTFLDVEKQKEAVNQITNLILEKANELGVNPKAAVDKLFEK